MGSEALFQTQSSKQKERFTSVHCIQITVPGHRFAISKCEKEYLGVRKIFCVSVFQFIQVNKKEFTFGPNLISLYLNSQLAFPQALAWDLFVFILSSSGLSLTPRAQSSHRANFHTYFYTSPLCAASVNLPALSTQPSWHFTWARPSFSPPYSLPALTLGICGAFDLHLQASAGSTGTSTERPSKDPVPGSTPFTI